MKTLLLIVVSAVLWVATATSTNASTLLIDDFSAPDLVFLEVVSSGQVKRETATGLADVLGHSRTLSLTASGSFGGADRVSLLIEIPPSGLSLNADSGLTPSMSVLYDNNGSGFDVDLTGADAVRVLLAHGDYLGSLTNNSIMSITLVDTSSTSLEIVKSWGPTGGTGPMMGPVNDMTIDFLLGGYTSFDFAHVASLKLSYQGVEANDLNFGSITAVPEAASLLLFALGGIAMSGLIQRKRPCASRRAMG